MLHTYVHGGLCIAIQYDDVTLIINPTLDNVQQKQRLDIHPWQSYVYTYGENAFSTIDISTVFSLVRLDTSAIITVAWLSILYYHGDTPLAKIIWLTDLDLLLVDFSVGMDMANKIAWSVKVKTVVPINLTHMDDPIWFCREVMLYHRWVPKYLKNGQYVVHDFAI
jgi:hypothetical protein